MNLRDDPHTCTNHSDVCAHCGQPLPGRSEPQYGERRTSRTGLAFTIGLHLLLVALYFYQPERTNEKPAPAREGEVVYVAPLVKPTPAMPQPSPSQPRERTMAPPERPRVERLPDTITVPDEPVPVAKAEPKPEPEPAPEPTRQPRTEIEPGMDMAEYIAKRRQQRGAPPEPPVEETEAQRGTRNALANVAAINGRSRDEGRGKATYTVRDVTFHGAVVDFNGYNPNFKRKWLSTITVEKRDDEPDVETAVINRMVEAIRRGMPTDFVFLTKSGRELMLSTRLEDEEELRAVLFREVFPEYRRRPR